MAWQKFSTARQIRPDEDGPNRKRERANLPRRLQGHATLSHFVSPRQGSKPSSGANQADDFTMESSAALAATARTSGGVA